VTDYLDAATDAAVEAGAMLRRHAPESLRQLSGAGRDVKLAADVQAERIIVQLLSARTPFDILTEEAGLIVRGGADDCRWIVDPLDGTFNYLRGLPCTCVSVALWRENEPILGVIYDFTAERLYTGVLGEGAFCNGAPIAVSVVDSSAEAVLCTGFPIATDFSDAALAQMIRRVQCFKKTRMLGSAAMSLAFVAAGLADAYAERDVKIWDVAAGLALVSAAGGAVSDQPRDALVVDVVAHNGRLEVP
jgi:fructose-1,6-bisphosphatase/inositol monophosphatase family enzyme